MIMEPWRASEEPQLRLGDESRRCLVLSPTLPGRAKDALYSKRSHLIFGKWARILAQTFISNVVPSGAFRWHNKMKEGLGRKCLLIQTSVRLKGVLSFIFAVWPTVYRECERIIRRRNIMKVRKHRTRQTRWGLALLLPTPAQKNPQLFSLTTRMGTFMKARSHWSTFEDAFRKKGEDNDGAGKEGGKGHSRRRGEADERPAETKAAVATVTKNIHPCSTAKPPAVISKMTNILHRQLDMSSHNLSNVLLSFKSENLCCV